MMTEARLLLLLAARLLLLLAARASACPGCPKLL